MDEMKMILENADFSKETTQKNQLFYELFRKPVPTAEERYTLLGDAELGLVNGGVRQIPEEEEKDGKPQNECAGPGRRPVR